MGRAAAYLRVSGLSQVNGDGFERQRQAICKRAKIMGVEGVSWFEERGVSGTTPISERPALSELLALAPPKGAAE